METFGGLIPGSGVVAAACDALNVARASCLFGDRRAVAIHCCHSDL